MRKILMAFLLVSSQIIAQDISLGKVTLDELKMTHYEKDSTANALILLEKSYVSAKNKGKNGFEKRYYVKIKIFKNSAFDLGTVKIPFFKKSEVKNITGVTYNLVNDSIIEKSILTRDNIFLTKFNKYIKASSFSLPNIKEGSVIEYCFILKSDFYNVYDVDFQSEIPKKKVIYEAKLPPIFYFNYRLIGHINPDTIKESIKKNCIGKSACQVLHYQFNDLPAFLEEDFIDNTQNYISRIVFEKKYFNPYGGFESKNFGWGLIDNFLHKTYDKKLKKVSFFKRVLPDSIKKENDTLLKVKKAYQFIRNHFTLNEDSDFSLAKSFKQKNGNQNNINLALYNTLKALKLDPHLVLLSTRDHGFLTKLHPTLEGFNYSMTHIKINNVDYFLDATDKQLPFGLVPFKTLNGDGRILDFDDNSYWLPIKSNLKTYSNTKIILTINKNDLISGNITKLNKGQHSYIFRKDIEVKKEDEYLASLEEENINLQINDYSVKNLNDLTKPVIENFNIEIENDAIDKNVIRFNPFIINRIKENPFKLNERKYPVNFGFTFGRSYTISIKYPDNLTLKKVPEEKAFTLPKNQGRVIFKVMKKTNEINFYFKFSTKKSSYSSFEYTALKELYNLIIKLQNSSLEFIKN